MSSRPPTSHVRPVSLAGRFVHELRLRFITALILIPAILYIIHLGGATFTLLMAMAGFVLLLEWHNMTLPQPHYPAFALLCAELVAAMLAAWLLPLDVALFALGLLAALTIALAIMPFPFPLPPILLIGGFAYFIPALAALIILRDLPHGGFFVFYLCLVVWLSDICAMFAGRMIGGARLAMHISPNKTWAGLCGGIAGALIGATLLFVFMPPDVAAHLPHNFGFIIMGGVVALISQMGDLCESWVKRHFGVKDSGTILPGHGGLLDRVDGLIAVVLFAFAIIFLRSPTMALDAGTFLKW